MEATGIALALLLLAAVLTWFSWQRGWLASCFQQLGWPSGANGRLLQAPNREQPAVEMKVSVDARAQRAERALDEAKLKALSDPSVATVAALEAAIDAARQVGVDAITVGLAQRRLREAEAARQAGGARSRLRETLEQVEAASTQSENDGGQALLLYVYEKHPPKRPTLSVAELRAMEDEGKLRKALLKAQRDYHPDRNQGALRETLQLDPDEWEVLCMTIYQQLATAHDRSKGARELEVD